MCRFVKGAVWSWSVWCLVRGRASFRMSSLAAWDTDINPELSAFRIFLTHMFSLVGASVWRTARVETGDGGCQDGRGRASSRTSGLAVCPDATLSQRTT